MDKIAEVKNELQLRSWTDMELARQRSGMTIKEWCEHEQISKSAYYYRLRKIRENLCEQVAVPIADIPACSAAAAPSIRIVGGSLSIEISQDVPAETVAVIIRELKC